MAASKSYYARQNYRFLSDERNSAVGSDSLFELNESDVWNVSVSPESRKTVTGYRIGQRSSSVAVRDPDWSNNDGDVINMKTRSTDESSDDCTTIISSDSAFQMMGSSPRSDFVYRMGGGSRIPSNMVLGYLRKIGFAPDRWLRENDRVSDGWVAIKWVSGGSGKMGSEEWYPKRRSSEGEGHFPRQGARLSINNPATPLITVASQTETLEHTHGNAADLGQMQETRFRGIRM